MSFKEGQLLNQPRIQVTRPEQVLRSAQQVFLLQRDVIVTVLQPTPVDSPAMNTRLGQRNRSNVQDSLTNLRSDISSLIEQSFGTTAMVKSPSSPCLSRQAAAPGHLAVPTLETSFGPNGVTATTTTAAVPPSAKVLTRAAMRRQSSAFEFGTKDIPGGRTHNKRDLGVLPTAGTIRRQSSAFELAAVNKRAAAKLDVPPDAVLQYMNSSVKDLVKKLEGKRVCQKILFIILRA